MPQPQPLLYYLLQGTKSLQKFYTRKRVNKLLKLNTIESRKKHIKKYKVNHINEPMLPGTTFGLERETGNGNGNTKRNLDSRERLGTR